MVVRSLQRCRTPRWHRAWRQRWAAVTDTPEPARPLVVGGRRPEDPRHGDVSGLDARLKGDRSIGCLVLSQPPEGSTDGAQEALVGLRCGIPALVWDARNPAARRGVEKTDETVYGLLRNLSGLREAVTE
ncbi:hypothetical protein [Streptomyces sp. NPDC088812]|uniref:VMAP-C domain-containing protein n=1 Tax=Streptomyces sp. NPDC088812 TaxID=3365905 RepID=UPI003812239D